jgi:hypothetical protein
MTMVVSLYEYYVRNCPLSEIYLIYAFWELSLLPPSDCHTENFVITFYISGDGWGSNPGTSKY